ncbi:MAG TPA: cytochrome c [Casimicrobiaceae bacterium]
MNRTRLVSLVAFATAALACAFALPVAGLSIELPRDTYSLKVAPGSELATAQCGTCHSFDYVGTQPPGKPLAFWKAEVEKMKKVYGAQIPDDQVEPIAQYLTRAYGDAK